MLEKRDKFCKAVLWPDLGNNLNNGTDNNNNGYADHIFTMFGK